VDIAATSTKTAIVVGRSVSQGAELIVLYEPSTDKEYVAARSISFNREQSFVIAIEPGTYVVQAIGAHGAPIGAREKAFSFSVSAHEAVYIGTFINEFHPPAPDEVKGRVTTSRQYGRRTCTRLMCARGYRDTSIVPPYGRVAVVDETETLVPFLRESVPKLQNVAVKTRLAQ
jgi:hypothetical protein